MCDFSDCIFSDCIFSDCVFSDRGTGSEGGGGAGGGGLLLTRAASPGSSLMANSDLTGLGGSGRDGHTGVAISGLETGVGINGCEGLPPSFATSLSSTSGGGWGV